MHHNLSISDLSFCSCKPPEYMLFLKLFDTVLKIHSSLQTLTHNLTPPSLQKLLLNIPVIPIVSKFYPNLSSPIYITMEMHQPVKRRGQIMPLKEGLNTALGYNHQSTCMPQLGTILLIIIVNYCVIIVNYFQL